MSVTVTTTVTRKSYVDSRHGQVHLRTAGPQDGSPVLLLHQVPSSSAMWSALLGPLAERGHRVVAMDLPGYGASDPVTPVPSAAGLGDYADAALDVLDALGIDAAHVLGHHTGASVGLTLAATSPDRVRSLAMWGIPVLSAEFARELATEPPPVWGPDFIDDVDAWWRNRVAHTAGPVLGPVMARSLTEMLQCAEHRPDGHNAVGRTDHLALLAAVRIPVLGLTGAREMLDGETRAVAASHPDTVLLADLGDVGMDVADEAPELLADVVSAHFARTD
ncbi:alpha/beta fold hydrolase [Pseudonocardia sp. WMMC193]|uniref:alpha/beta fold hydrolase n=1 Tax=Pseudonocardia sp. WMMC193 TaxID=2911965 RepID=UPI001F2E8ACE|nr:alpha/beta hydrolase [Pseudonocardia sp. WMMC193]MCF7550000.1 alpha/beta fold hydrolase [Pseudonocardia sp. WMMC193]